MVNKTMWKRAAILMALAVCLTACGSTKNPSEMQGNSQQTENTAVGGVTTNGLEFLSYYTGGYASDTGFYTGHIRDGGHHNICYVDFATGQEVVLCNQINCTHDSDACNSWIAGNGDGPVYKTIPVGDKVVLLYQGLIDCFGDATPSYVAIMNPDGTNRHIIQELGLSTGLGTVDCGGYVRDMENLYFITSNAETFSYTLRRVHVPTETVEKICDLEGEEEQIIGCIGKDLILSYTPGGTGMNREKRQKMKTKIVRLNLDTREKVELLEHPACDYGACADGKFYVVNSLTKTICTYDLTDGALLQEVPVADSTLLDWETVVWPHGVYDGRFLVDNGMNSYLGIDPATGKITELKHTFFTQDGAGESFCWVETQTKDGFLIVSGATAETYTFIDEEGKECTNTAYFPTHSLISKDDFWSNHGNGVPIVDARD